MRQGKSRVFHYLFVSAFVLYGLLAFYVRLAPSSWSPPWLAVHYFHTTAGCLLWLAAALMWLPLAVLRRPLVGGGLLAAVAILVLPLLLPGLRTPPTAPLLVRLLWPPDAFGWPIMLIVLCLASFALLSLRQSRFSRVLSLLVSWLVLAGAALGIAGNFLKLDLIYNQPLLAPVPLPIALALLVYGLMLLWQRELMAAQEQGRESREDRLISSIGLGLLITIAFSTGLASFISLQAQVEGSLYQAQLLAMDNRIIIFYHAMDNAYSELSQVARNSQVEKLLAELDTKPADEQRRQLLEFSQSNLPLSVTAFEYRTSDGKVQVKQGEFLPSRTIWVDYRGTTEIHLDWRDGLPFLTLQFRINAPDQSKVGELVLEQRMEDWEQLVTDTYDLGRTGGMMVCGLQSELTSCFDSRDKFNLLLPAEGDPLMPMIMDSFEGERSASQLPLITRDLEGRPKILTYGSIGRVRLATKAAGIYLGMLIATDAEEFYEPVRRQLKDVLPLLLAIIVAGTIVLRRLVVPLVRALRDKEARFRELTGLSSDCYWQMNARFEFVELTGVDLPGSGIRVDAWLGRSIAQLPVTTDEKTDIADLERQMRNEAFFYDVTLRIAAPDNVADVHFVSLSGAPLYDAGGRFIGYRGVGKDITLRKLAEEALHEAQQGLELRVEQRTAELSVEVQERTQAEARFRSLVELSSDWYWEVDRDNRFVQLSGEVERKGGFAAADCLGRTFWEQSWVIQEENDWDSLRILLGSQQPFYEYTLKTRDFEGAVRYLAISGQPVLDAHGACSGYRGTGKDVTEKRLSEERIHFLAHYDALTQLPNRTLLYEQVRGAIERAKRYKHKLALLFIDLDRFKIINDSLGHDAGDEVLRTVAQRLKECVRDCDMVSRLGGDEFVILLENLQDAAQASYTARRVLDLINLPFVLVGESYNVGASIGISLYPEDGDSINELLRHSDAAMYRAKSEGRNGIFFFSNALNDDSMAVFRLENDLRQAVEQQQFILHYQPKIDLARQEIVGVEALLRWRHPVRGMVPPLDFIPMAEECGLIVAIGEWVINEALAQLVAWDQAGLMPMTMALNLSPRQLQPQLPAVLLEALQRHGVPPQRLELELTESLMLQRPERDIQLLATIRDMGIRIALDDFGTGFSSLSSLATLPIDYVKMDKSFVDRLPNDTTSAAISRSILTLAQGVGLDVVAEGVETLEQWNWLSEQGCHQVQGYYFSKPLPAAAAFSFIAAFFARVKERAQV